jgi:hypothetical protein
MGRGREAAPGLSDPGLPVASEMGGRFIGFGGGYFYSYFTVFGPGEGKQGRLILCTCNIAWCDMTAIASRYHKTTRCVRLGRVSCIVLPGRASPV